MGVCASWLSRRFKRSIHAHSGNLCTKSRVNYGSSPKKTIWGAVRCPRLPGALGELMERHPRAAKTMTREEPGDLASFEITELCIVVDWLHIGPMMDRLCEMELDEMYLSN